MRLRLIRLETTIPHGNSMTLTIAAPSTRVSSNPEQSDISVIECMVLHTQLTLTIATQ